VSRLFVDETTAGFVVFDDFSGELADTVVNETETEFVEGFVERFGGEFGVDCGVFGTVNRLAEEDPPGGRTVFDGFGCPFALIKDV